MRILYFSRSYTVHDRRFLEALGKSGHETCFLQLEDAGVVKDQRRLPSGVKALSWAGRRRLFNGPADPASAIEEFARIFEQFRPDIVHAGPIHSCAYIAAAAKARPLMAVSWGSDLLVDADSTEILRQRTLFALNHADMLLADCREVADKALALTGFSPERIVQFPWGVELDTFKPGQDRAGLRKEFGSDGLVLLSTRSWEPSYGILHLLEGFLEAHRAIPRLGLFLLGTGSLRSEIEAFVRNNHLSEAIRMPGQIPVSSLPKYYRAADLYVSCTFSDGSSISLLEAMASCLPVIVTDRPSNREWITGGSGGLLVKFADSNAIRDAIIRIASMNTEQRKEWGNRNLKIARERADWRRNFRMLLDAYQTILGRATCGKSKA